ncbi:MAG: S9 family peptidase [Gammaproteobacteria bacterium]|nr:S9 family peptidase [Gammaproteobacteria bacterium]
MKSTTANMAAALLCLTAALPLTAKPVAVTDIMHLSRIHSAAVSPNGDLLVYGIAVNSDLEKSSNLYLKDLNQPQQPAMQLTSSQSIEHDVVWSADSKSIYFIAERPVSSQASARVSEQVWRLNLAGGEAMPITQLGLPVLGLKLSPDNSKIALSLPAFSGCQNLECNISRYTANFQQKQQSADSTNDWLIRTNNRWQDLSSRHIYVGDLAAGKVSHLVDIAAPEAGAADLTLAGLDDFSFSADGQSIVYAAKVAQATSNNYDLWQLPLSSGPAINLTPTNIGTDLQPIFSSDGRFMAYLAQDYQGNGTQNRSIILVDLITTKAKELAPLWDRSATSIAFAADSRNIYVTANDMGQHGVFVVNSQFGDIKRLYSEGNSQVIGLSHDNLVIDHSSLNHPRELFLLNRAGGNLQPVSAVNQAKLNQLSFGEFSQFSYRGWNDELVYGYWIKPSNYQQGKKYPMVVLVNHNSDRPLNRFSAQGQPQIWAGAGYGVVTIDLHGAVGYGHKFADSTVEDWGGKPLEDLQKGLAAVVKQQPWLDNEKTCAIGSGLGGYLVNWIAGQWPDQFDCLVNHGGIFDLRMHYQLTSQVWHVQRQFGGSYNEVPDNYQNYNPANFTSNWTTPIIFSHGGHDPIISPAQSTAGFNALKRNNVATKLMVFPQESQQVTATNNLSAWYQQVFAWVAQYTQPNVAK